MQYGTVMLVPDSSVENTESAKSPVLDLTQSGRSLMNSKNSNGPRTVPCGTPLMTGMFSDAAPSTKACCVRSVRKPLIQLWVLPLIP